MNASPLEPPLAPLSPADADDLAEDKDREINTFRPIVRTRKVRDSSLYDISMLSANLSMTDDGESEGEENWTLKLRKGDEAHLDDL